LTRLFVNVDHVATVREARKTVIPDPLAAALIAEEAGAHGITVHLREDRRHIQDDDVWRIRRGIRTPLNLEMAAVEEMVRLAAELVPHQVSLVPEKRQEITTEGGLDVASEVESLTKIRQRLSPLGIRFSLFVDPDEAQLRAAARVAADSIEINTGLYSEMNDAAGRERERLKIAAAATLAHGLGLKVFAGHGLNLDNVRAVAAIPEIEELNIGHSLVARSILVGFRVAVSEMLEAIESIDK
jgi:pyridoxine 5-phosphate synthase